MEIGPTNESTELRELVFALAHEIANLLAGSRLEAGLLDPAAGAPELQRAADRISEASARAGSLLAMLRPLLAPETAPPLPIDALELLAGLRGGLDESSDARVVIALKSAVEVPVVRLAPDSLHHLLLTAIWAGLEAAPGDAPLRVFCRADGDRVAFVVEDDGPAPDLDPDGQLRGRPLSWAITRSVLAAMEGRFFVTRDEAAGRTRVTLDFPADAD
jgi:signal transduction histidine kinase